MKSTGSLRECRKKAVFGLAAGAACCLSNAQGTLTFRFEGTIRSSNPASSLFANAAPGSPVSGFFTIDLAVQDGSAAPDFGAYHSPQFTIGGSLAGNEFATAISAGNAANVDNRPLSSGDFVVLTGTPVGYDELSLTFFDRTGAALVSDRLPETAEAYNRFPDLVLYGRRAGSFGQYVIDANVTLVPEPSAAALGLFGVGLAGAFRWRRQLRRAALNAAACSEAPASCSL